MMLAKAQRSGRWGRTRDKLPGLAFVGERQDRLDLGVLGESLRAVEINRASRGVEPIRPLF